MKASAENDFYRVLFSHTNERRRRVVVPFFRGPAITIFHDNNNDLGGRGRRERGFVGGGEGEREREKSKH